MSSQKKEHLYQVRVFDASGDLEAIYDDLVSVMYTKYINKPGLAVLTVRADHDLLNYQDQNRYFQIWISYSKLSLGTNYALNQSWSLDFDGLYRDTQFVTDQDGIIYAQLYIPSLMSLLDRYVNAYTAGTNNKTIWTGTELATIANDVVLWNVTEDALAANDRLRDATQIRGLTDDGSVAGSALVNYSVNPGRSVLEFLQELAPICNFDFDVVYESSASVFHVHQYAGQLGDDLSASILFDLALDNASKANYTGDKLREKTVAIVGGPGDGAARTFSVRYGANYATTNEYEIYVDARSNDTSELDDIGDAALAKYQARAQVQAQIRDSHGWQYARDYNLGDLVSISFAGIIATKKISRVEVVFDQTQKNQVSIDFSDITA